jgi:hypothetical protein
MFEEQITPSTNANSTRCFDDLGTRVNQVLLCKYANLVGQVSSQKWGVSSSTPYPPR